MKKRKLFAEIAEGFEALAAERTGKRTLRTHADFKDSDSLIVRTSR